MTDNTIQPDTENLEDFEKLLYGKTPSPDEEDDGDVETEDVEIEDVVEEDDGDDSPAPEAPPKKKATFQERIDELTAARRNAEREAAELRALLEEKEKPAPVEREVPEPKDTRPSPNELGPDGEPKYPLGEYDPQYISDLVIHLNEIERVKLREELANEQKAQAAQQAAAAAQQALSNEWTQKLEAVEEQLPDIREKGAKLVEAFADFDQGHAEYLATAIMKLPHGPEVLYYLSENIVEAKRLASQDPLTAALELGALSAQYKDAAPEKKVKITEAPPPPINRARGAGGKFSVSPDTEDLESFEKLFYS